LSSASSQLEETKKIDNTHRSHQPSYALSWGTEALSELIDRAPTIPDHHARRLALKSWGLAQMMGTLRTIAYLVVVGSLWLCLAGLERSAQAQEQVAGGWSGRYLGPGPDYDMAPVGDPYAACAASWASFTGNAGLKMDSFGFGGRNSSGQVNTAYCSCGIYCAGGYWGTAGSARYVCPAGYHKSLDPPHFCTRARPVDSNSCQASPGGQPSPSEAFGSNSATVGDPIDVSSGTLLHRIPVFSTSDGLFEFSLDYNSRSEFRGSTGWGWSGGLFAAYEHSYTHAWVQDPTGRMMHFKSIGGAWRPRKIDGSVWSTSTSVYRTDVSYSLTTNGSGNFVYTDESGISYTFTKNGNVNTSTGTLQTKTWPDGYAITRTFTGSLNTQISDSRGRSATLTYHPNQLLASVTDPDGAVYKFEYVNAAGPVPTATDEAVNTAYLARIIMPDDTPLTDADNPTIEMHYDIIVGSFMELTGITDERGVRIATWDYADGRPISFEGPNGFNATEVSYDDTNHITNVTTALGKETDYKHTLVNGVRKLTEVDGVASTNCAASDTTYNLDANGMVSREIAPEGERTRYVRNARGLPTTIEEGETTALSRTTTITWHSTFPVPTQIVEPGRTSTFSVDSQGQILSATLTDTTAHSVPYVTNGLSRDWTFTYLSGGGGKVTSIDGPLSGTVDKQFFTYDAFGNLATITDANGQLTTVNSVNGRGQPTSITDPNGIVTTITYTPRGWVSDVTVHPGASERQTSFDYDDAGNLTRMTFPSGGWFDYVYADEGFVESITSSQGERAEFAYDLLGNLLSESRKTSGGPVEFSYTQEYDELGRLLRAIGASGQTTAFAYNRSDILTTITDPRAKMYAYGFDALNRVVSFTDPEGDVNGFDYSSADDLTEFTDGGGVATTYVHNGFGDVIRETSPDRGVTDYWYDAAGNLVKRIDAAGQEVNFGYDQEGRLLSEQFVGASGLNRTYTYDSTSGGNFGVGRLTGATDAHGSLTLVYNAFGEVVTETRVTGGMSYTTGYVYDDNGALVEASYPSGRTVTYDRDDLGRLVAVETVSASGQPVRTVASAIDWKPFGPLAGYAAGNGLQASFAYDDDYDLANISVDDGGTALLDLDLGRDASGNIVSIDDTLSPGRSYAFTYTDDDRLASSTGPAVDTSWTYDDGGNRSTETRTIGGVTETDTYVYLVGTNRLSGIYDATPSAIRTFAYDAKGQTTEDDHVAGPDFDYVYTADGRLSSVDKNGTLIAEYGYDGWGRRITRETHGVGAATRHYIYDQNGLPIAETDGAGNTLREYIWLEGRLIGVTSGSGAGSTLYHVHGGHVGQPLRMTSSSKAVVWDVDMEPFGQAAQVVALTDIDLRLPGQWEQFEAGLYQNWWRDYDPTTGRYLQPDRLGLGGGPNMYSYANQSPLTYIDPDGQRVFGAGTLLFALSGVLDWANERVQCSPYANTPLAMLVSGMKAANDLASWSPQGLLRSVAKGRPPAGLLPKGRPAPKPPRAKGGGSPDDKAGGPRRKPPCGCFVAGTLVMTPSGLRPIEDIEVGDLVMAWDEKSGRVEMRAVTHLIRPDPKLVWRLEARDADGELEVFFATDDHPWLIQGLGWVETKSLRAGQVLTTADGRGMAVVEVAPTDRVERTYNLSVAGFQTFLLGEDGAVVHNAPCLEALSKAASAPDRNGLTKAGRALQKHGDRPGSAYPKMSSGRDLNETGQNIVDDILTTPGSIQRGNRFGGIDVVSPGGRGVRYDGSGNFMGFLEP
jgi:RHS repeat-associated protein